MLFSSDKFPKKETQSVFMKVEISINFILLIKKHMNELFFCQSFLL